jgi:hypothetical protein
MNNKIIKIQVEKQFQNWFKKNYKKFGFEKIIRHNVSISPDFIMLKNGKEVGVELETLVSNFILHKHNIAKINFVLCLIKDIELGIPILEVKELKYEPKYRRVTISLDDKLYSRFQKFCEDNHVIVSKRIERLMNEMLDSNDKRWRK